MKGVFLVVSSHYYQQALSAERNREYTTAIGLFKCCLSFRGVDEGDLSFHVGWCIEQRDGVTASEALEWYEVATNKALEAGCRVNAWFRAGWIHMHRKETRKAVSMYRQAVAEGDLSSCINEPYCHAVYWLGACFEAEGFFADAGKQYRRAAALCPSLLPEAILREMRSLIAIGCYEKALEVSREFPLVPPAGVDRVRFEELKSSVESEQAALKKCMEQSFHPTSLVKHHAD